MSRDDKSFQKHPLSLSLPLLFPPGGVSSCPLREEMKLEERDTKIN